MRQGDPLREVLYNCTLFSRLVTKKTDHNNQTTRAQVTQSAQAKTEQILSNAVKRMGLSEKDLAHSEDNRTKISER